MKRLFFTLSVLCTVLMAAGQQDGKILTLEYCHQQAVANHPLQKQFALIDASGALQVKNIGKNYLPDLAINGQMSYQSDVTKVPFPVQTNPDMAIYPIDKDWYKITFDVNQLIYDGGVTKHNKLLENTETQISMQNIEVQLYELKHRVDQVYFQILLLQENRKLIEVHKNEIETRIVEVESAVRNGVVLKSNIDVLRAELMKVEQQIIEIDFALDAAVAVLAELMSIDIADGAKLELPENEIELGINEKKRPEYSLFDYQHHQLDAYKKLTGTRHLPKFSGFGQLGYGRPAFDMLNNNFEDFYIVGIRMNWDLWHWNETRNDKSIIDLNKKILDNQLENFDKNLRIEIEQNTAEILKYESLIQKDAEMVVLREQIAKTSSAQLANGIITATDYLTELRAETEAKLKLEIHKIELAGAIINYLAVIGEL